jgi:chromate transport protein ChrA
LKKILFEVLRRVTAFAICIGIYQFFKSMHVFDSLDGAVKFLPLAVMMIALNQIFQRSFKFDQKSHLIVLTVILAIGVGSASYFS